MKIKEFDLGTWGAVTTYMVASYEALHTLLTDENTLMYHVNHLPIVGVDADFKVIALPDEETQFHPLRKSRLEGIADAGSTYRRQMIVLIVTYWTLANKT